ncbi:glycosyltransferase family 1 protein [bacterium]|nr:MAG: glycosyltransferase family 1 protein [bacterium]
MRITSITAGAGGMYCGSCIRDNALAKALLQLGHEVLLVPLYTPPRTDGPSVSEQRVFFGGISVYLEQYSRLFRSTPWMVDRLWESPWLLRAVSQRGVQTQPEQLGELTVSILEGQHGHQQKEFDKLVHWLQTQPSPDVIDISNSMLISLAPALKQALGRPICCTLQGENIFLDHLSEPYRSRALSLIREHAQSVDRFIAVSDYCAGYMAEYLQIPGAKLDVVPLGISVDEFSPTRRSSERPFTVGYLGRIAPEKGVHLLCDAYHRLREQNEFEDCRLEFAGYLGPEHRGYLEGLTRQISDWGLQNEIRYRGPLEFEDKVSFFRELDLFAVPATYDDPKGLALLEAMACGVPVIAPDRGTYTEFIQRTGGGVLVPPEDPESLMAELVRLRNDDAGRSALGQSGSRAVREQYSADAMAVRALDVYSRLHAASN